MKKLAMIYRWIILSVLLQAVFLSYLNFVYLPNRGTIKATMYEFGDDSLKSRDVRVPSGARNITVSYNGLFAAYLKDGRLTIADIQKGESIKTLEPADGEFTYFRWLPDRDMLIYSTRATVKGKGQVVISTYEIGTSLDRGYPEIKSLPEGSSVTDIELSPLTNIVYVLVKTSETKSRLYKFNIMDDLSFVMNGDAGMLIKETAYSDMLFYQNDNGVVMKRNGKTGKASKVFQEGGRRLLAVDSDDNAYIGLLDQTGRVTGISFGKSDQDAKQWQKIELASPASPSDVFVTPGGEVFTADRASGKILKPDGSAAGKFEGDLLEVLDDYTVSLDGSRVGLAVIDR